MSPSQNRTNGRHIKTQADHQTSVSWLLFCPARVDCETAPASFCEHKTGGEQIHAWCCGRAGRRGEGTSLYLYRSRESKPSLFAASLSPLFLSPWRPRFGKGQCVYVDVLMWIHQLASAAMVTSAWVTIGHHHAGHQSQSRPASHAYSEASIMLGLAPPLMFIHGLCWAHSSFAYPPTKGSRVCSNSLILLKVHRKGSVANVDCQCDISSGFPSGHPIQPANELLQDRLGVPVLCSCTLLSFVLIAGA